MMYLMGLPIYVGLIKSSRMVLIAANSHRSWGTELFFIYHLGLGDLHLVFATTIALTPQIREPV